MKLGTLTKILNLLKLVLDSGIAVSDVRARREEEKRKAEDDAKDKKIKELESEIKKLKEKKS